MVVAVSADDENKKHDVPSTPGGGSRNQKRDSTGGQENTKVAVQLGSKSTCHIQNLKTFIFL